AAAHGAAITQDGAGAAHAVLAAHMNAVGLQFVAQEVGEQHARLGMAGAAAAVERELDAAVVVRLGVPHSRCSPSLRARARASAAAARTTRPISSRASARRYAALAT